MFEKFTELARKVMSVARQESQRLNCEFIGTEHILLGIISEGGGVAAKVLKNMSVDLKRVRQEVEKLITPSTSPAVTLGQIPFSPRAKRVIELAGEAAIQLEHDVIGTEHLLLGLIKEANGIAAQVLINLGLKLDAVRDMVTEVLGADKEKTPPPALPAPAPAPGKEADIAALPNTQDTPLSSEEMAEMVVAAWLGRGGQDSIPNHTIYLTKMIAFAIEAARRGVR